MRTFWRPVEGHSVSQLTGGAHDTDYQWAFDRPDDLPLVPGATTRAPDAGSSDASAHPIALLRLLCTVLVMTTNATAPALTASSSPAVVALPHDDRWAFEPDAGCSQDFQLRLTDGWLMTIETDHGYLGEWTLLTPEGQQPASGPVRGQFEFGRFEMAAVTDLANTLAGAQLAAAHPVARAIVDRWTQNHSMEADEDRTGYETVFDQAHTLQEKVIRMLDNLLVLTCTNVRVHLRSSLFDELRVAFREFGDKTLLPFAHIEVVSEDDLSAFTHTDVNDVSVVISFEFFGMVRRTITDWETCAVHTGGRLYLPMLW